MDNFAYTRYQLLQNKWKWRISGGVHSEIYRGGWYIIIHVSGVQVPLPLPKIQPRFIRGLIFDNYDSRDAGRQRRICVNAGVFYFAYLFLIFRRNTV